MGWRKKWGWFGFYEKTGMDLKSNKGDLAAVFLMSFRTRSQIAQQKKSYDAVAWEKLSLAIVTWNHFASQNFTSCHDIETFWRRVLYPSWKCEWQRKLSFHHLCIHFVDSIMHWNTEAWTIFDGVMKFKYWISVKSFTALKTNQLVWNVEAARFGF